MVQNKLKVIGGKDLGSLALPDFCPRCFWIERHWGNPPSIFPGIFSTLDAVTRRSVHRAFLRKSCSPDWLPVPDAIEVEEGDTYFKLPIQDKGWVLAGKPDDIFRLKDGTYHIVDYKTAKFTGRQDELFPMYEIQLNCYAYLAEKYGFKPVSRLSLIYCQPNQDLSDDENFSLDFEIYSIEVDIDLEKVSQLLVRAREIVDQKELPEARYNCKGICIWVDRILRR